MEFEYRLDGAGWSAAHIAIGDNSAALTASYLSDALGDLLEAVASLVDGRTTTRCSWEEEPGEFRWLFHRDGPDVSVVILTFDDAWENKPDSDGVIAFSAMVPLRELADAVVAAAERVLAEHGEDGYLAEWIDYPFPSKALARLRAGSDGARD